MAHEYVASKEAYEKTAQIMSSRVSIPTSDRCNAKYDGKDLHHALTALAISNSYAESGMSDLAIEVAAAAAAKKKVPSGSWVRDAVEKVEESKMTVMLQEALHSTLDLVKPFGVFSTPIMGALDKHKIPRYDPTTDKGYLTRGKHERGTTRYETYGSLQCVEEGMRAQIVCEHVGLFDENSELVAKLVTRARLEGIRVYLLLLDREFFSCKVINGLGKLRQPFLMPVKLTKGIKKALTEYIQGKRPMISRYVMQEGREDESSFTLVIFPKAGCDEKSEPDPIKRLIPFATNLPVGKILWNVSMLPKDYRKRWGIERGYVEVERFRARTTSRNHTLRLLYFFYALILYNAWLLANLMLAKMFSKFLTAPIIRVAIMKAVTRSIILASLMESGG
jgi:putative transposase